MTRFSGVDDGRGPASCAPKPPAKGGISDKSVLDSTGHGLDHWFACSTLPLGRPNRRDPHHGKLTGSSVVADNEDLPDPELLELRRAQWRTALAGLQRHLAS